MLMLLSPAKTLDFTPAPDGLPVTRPEFASDASKIAKLAKMLGPADLKRLMGVSDKLAALNVARFKVLKIGSVKGAVPAVLAFDGDVYTGLGARDLDPPSLQWAQQRLRILSGLYGVLRPLDLIHPYRLEMGVRLANPAGDDLYAFWRDKVARTLNAAVRGHADPTVVDLASQEYFRAVDRKALKPPVVACQFKERRGGELKMISVFAKTARGAMARFAIDGRIDRVEGLKAFDRDGYAFAPEVSTAQTWTFVRDPR